MLTECLRWLAKGALDSPRAGPAALLPGCAAPPHPTHVHQEHLFFHLAWFQLAAKSVGRAKSSARLPVTITSLSTRTRASYWVRLKARSLSQLPLNLPCAAGHGDGCYGCSPAAGSDGTRLAGGQGCMSA